MKRRKKILIAISSFFCFAAVCGAIHSVKAPKVIAEGELSEVTYEENYIIGDTLSLQEAKITYGGKQYTAQSFLHFPNGKVLDKDSVVLTESGKYTIEYKAQADDVVLSEKVDITVLNRPYSFEGNGEVI